MKGWVDMKPETHIHLVTGRRAFPCLDLPQGFLEQKAKLMQHFSNAVITSERLANSSICFLSWNY